MDSLLEAAQRYVQMGYSVVSTNQNKEATADWRVFQNRQPAEWELSDMFMRSGTSNLAIICGQISGGLEVLDFDLKYDTTGKLFHLFWSKAAKALPELCKRLVVARSRNGGFHLFYKCSKPGRNMRLAQRETTSEERLINPKEKRKVLIETRGEAGIIIVAPSAGYRFVQGDLSRVATITDDERNVLLSIARSFNQIEITRKPKSYPQHTVGNCDMPFDDYNNRITREDFVALMEKHGWTEVRATDEKTYFLRPGATKSKSSGDFHHQRRVFSVFSSSTEFEPETGYRPSTVFAMLECNGDFKLAAKKLLELGYGRSYRQMAYLQRKPHSFIRR